MCGWTNTGAVPTPTRQPSQSTAVGSHPIQTGPFGAAPTVTNYHTVQVFTSSARPRADDPCTTYRHRASTAARGHRPVGETSTAPAPITMSASRRPSSPATPTSPPPCSRHQAITSVEFYHDSVGPANLIGTDTTYPYEADWDTAAASTAGAPTDPPRHRPCRPRSSAHPSMPRWNSASTSTTSRSVRPPPPNTANIDNDCPGAARQRQQQHLRRDGRRHPGQGPQRQLGPDHRDLGSRLDVERFPTSWDQNKNFSLNAFAWIMDNMLPDVPDDTYFPLTNPVRVYDSRQATAIDHGTTRAIQLPVWAEFPPTQRPSSPM